MTFIEHLISLFEANRNTDNAFHMKNYMKGHFEFYGIKATERRQLLREASRINNIQLRQNVRGIALKLYALPERELHHCAIELIEKELRKNYKKDDITLIETLTTTNSWWDTVDFIAKNILGTYLLIYPSETKGIIHKFSSSQNMWLNRSAILFQLGYKEKTDASLFFDLCIKHKHSKEFFIQKAIGWALREYGKTYPMEVLNFVKSAELKPLSEREAIRNIK